MHSMLLTSDKDPMGAAIIDYLAHGKASKLRVFSSMFDEDEIPVNQLFRTFQEMPSLEQKALQLSTGKILDVGAGSDATPWLYRKWVKRLPLSTYPLFP